VAEIPSAVLSEYLEERMEGRRLVSAAFLTYQFEPAFFEQEVLPVLLDVPLSHATAIRLLQLEDGLKHLRGQIAVYYDANGLIPSDAGSAKLDVRRIPIRHETGIFHPKNVLLLVEAKEPDGEGHHPRTFLVACLSANLTRSGWWENVEVCHVEEIGEGDKTRLRDDLLSFIEWLQRKANAETEHPVLQEMLRFLKKTEQRAQRSTDDHLHTHFYSGQGSVPDFLDQVAGERLRGTYLEIISPFFDDAEDCRPLEELVERFQPKEVRVFLPRSSSGEALCRKELYESVRAMSDVHWSRLPKDKLRLGRSEDAKERFVHAKVYRFFTMNPKRELYFIGSANLTTAAHQRGGNVETGFLVEVKPPRRPDFWLTPEERQPVRFHAQREDEGAAASGGTRLNLRYHWDRKVAEAWWDGRSESPALHLEARGSAVGTVGPLESRTWTPLEPALAAKLEELLAETSFLQVLGEGKEPALLLVQEEGMSHKPSLLMRLSAADILKYWSLLTPEQRVAFLEARAPELALHGPGADLVARAKVLLEDDTLFDRFAGFFHAFGCLERAVHEALKQGNERQARYRLFGRKYDSLGCLLDRVLAADGAGDDVDQYVIILCARQVCREVAREWPDFWKANREDARQLEERFKSAGTIRERLVARAPEEMTPFLNWFESWFLRRASQVQEVAA
jgi:hypothetical protein